MGSLPVEQESPSWHSSRRELISTLENAITQERDALRQIASDMYDHPELGFEEFKAAKWLADYMESKGFKVRRQIANRDTAWSAECQVGDGGATIGFNSEMDALPGVGHACGHQLIAISGCAAAVGVVAALKEHSIAGRVLLLGTPAEESGGGKIEMLDAGEYDTMAACLMLHPHAGGNNAHILSTNARQIIEAEFFGKPAHAAGSPEAGINAMDAAVQSYNAVTALRHACDRRASLFCSFRGESHWAVNIIPDYAKVIYSLRAPTLPMLETIVSRVKNCIEGAALSVGCKFKIDEGQTYADLVPNPPLEQCLKSFAEDRWQGYSVEPAFSSASTDFGNVTYKVPGIHPSFDVPEGKDGDYPHSETFAAVAHKQSSFDAALKLATSISVVGLRVVEDKQFRENVRSAWREQVSKARGKLEETEHVISDKQRKIHSQLCSC
ncbi:hypothetical protein OIO90_005841 [Microbotryomycetes sp. JL221]|nr:hypothetical protein OIO90_005841 [Microbotryomycetes sp. JL221]